MWMTYYSKFSFPSTKYVIPMTAIVRIHPGHTLQDYLRMHYSDRLRHAADFDALDNNLHDQVTESVMNYESISAEVRKLPEKQSTILQLIHQDGYTAKEVGEKIGMNTSAVKVAAHRAYKILKKALER
jgi:RNA polymerase sigma-70 factor (ECF subfamily)